MTRARLLWAAVLAAAIAGGVLGFVTRPAARARGTRPKAVAEVLKALERADKGESATLTAALAAAGAPSTYAAPWREEVLLGELAARGDLDALWRFADGGPASAPRARALLWIGAHGRDDAERARARERLRAEYPDSWLHATRASGDGR